MQDADFLQKFKIDPVRLESAKLQPTAGTCALKLMDCMFTLEELVKSNPSGVTKSKDPDRACTLSILDPHRMTMVSACISQYV